MEELRDLNMEDITVTRLKDLLRRCGKDTKGRKVELVARLLNEMDAIGDTSQKMSFTNTFLPQQETINMQRQLYELAHDMSTLNTNESMFIVSEDQLNPWNMLSDVSTVCSPTEEYDERSNNGNDKDMMEELEAFLKMQRKMLPSMTRTDETTFQLIG